MNNSKKLTLVSLVLMVLTSVFGFNNVPRAFYKEGYAAIPCYILSGLLFFIPYAFMMAEYGTSFKKEKGGIYSWMEKSIGGKFAFVGTFVWYASYIIWMVSVAVEIWIPLSNLVFGKDITSSLSFLGLKSAQSLGILAVLFVIIVTLIASKGLQKVSRVASAGGIAVIFLNVMLFLGAVIILIMHGGKLMEPITSAKVFIDSPDISNSSFMSLLSFLVFAIFAYGGIETVGGLVDETENPEKNFPKGMILSAVVMMIGYSLGILVCGIFLNWKKLNNVSNVNLANISYIIMKNLGYTLGTSLGLGNAVSLNIGAAFARMVGLSMFLVLTGSFFIFAYSPLKQMIEGTPKELWPDFISKVNEDGMPKNAMIVQCIMVCVILIIISFGGNGVSQLFSYIVLMTNVAMTIPYIFISIAFIGFKRKKYIKKPFEIFKSRGSGEAAGIVVSATVFFADLFTIIEPLLKRKPDIESSIWMAAGPLIFVLISLLIYKRYEKKRAK